MFRGDTGVDVDVPDRPAQFLLVHGFDLAAGQRPGGLFRDAEVGGDARGRDGVVAGDHDGADARAVRLRDGLDGLRSRRIDDGDNAEVDQVVFGVLGEGGGILFEGATPGDTERAVSLGAQAFDVRLDPAAAFVAERHDVVADQFGRAALQQHVGGALGEQPHVLVGGSAPEHGHYLAFGGERHLADAFPRPDPLGHAVEFVLGH